MKSVLAGLSWVALSGVTLLLIATCIRPPAGHMDFNLRMNELACVRQRVNPYDVWTESVTLPPYYSNVHIGARPEGCIEQVNAYAPWEYIYMMPFSFLSRSSAWFSYCLVIAAAFVSVLWLSGIGSTKDAMLASALPLLVVSYTVWSDVSVGNFGIIVLASVVAMAWALNRERKVLAGVFWAVAMVKPQIGLVFAVPLLMRMRWTSCIFAGAICLAATWVAARVCRAGVVEMLLQGPAANTCCFHGCGTWPKFLCGMFGGNGDILAGTLIGVVVCTLMTWLVRKERDWFVLLMPAAMTSCCWTYTQAYSHVMGWFVAFVLVCQLLAHPQSKFLWSLAMLAVFSLTRWFLAWHGLVSYCGWRFPMTDYAFRCVDSLNSTFSLAIAFALCVWIVREERMCHHE